MVTATQIDEARSILSRINPKETYLIVVPNHFDMAGQTNPGLTLQQKTAMWFKMNLRKESKEYDLPAQAFEDLIDKVGAKTILVRESALSGSDIYKSGVIWHEYGHVISDQTETGRVFAHEMRKLVDNFGGQQTLEYIVQVRGADYLKQALPEGMADLIAVLKEVNSDGSLNELIEYLGKKAGASKKV